MQIINTCKSTTKFALFLIIFTGMLFLSFTASAETEGYYTYTVSNNEATITKFDKTVSGEVVIPTTLGGKPVTTIGQFVFSDRLNISKVTIPNTVTNIQANAFDGCKGMTEIKLPSSLETIASMAFTNCQSLTSIEIPSSVKSIGNNAFYGCGKLTAVYIKSIDAWCSIDFKNEQSNPLYYAKNLYLNGTLVKDAHISSSTVNSYAFYNCTSIQSVSFSNNVNFIGKYVFANCSNLGNSIEIPTTVTNLGDGAFYQCEALKRIYIYGNITSIGQETFRNCSALEFILLPPTLEEIGNYAFSGCTNLEDLTLPETLVSIGERAFQFCQKLKYLTIPDSVKTISAYAFSQCRNIIELNIGSGVEELGSSAFADVTPTKLNIKDIAQWCNLKTYGNASNPLAKAQKLYLNGSLVENLIIPDGVTAISRYAFMNCTSIKIVTIPESMKTINSSAFNNCTNLKKVYYNGTQAQWSSVSIDSYNDPLKNAAIYYYGKDYSLKLNSITAATNGYTVTGAFKNNLSNSLTNTTIYICVYSPDNSLKAIVPKPVTVQGVSTVDINETIGCTTASGDIIKLLVWNSSLKSICNSDEVTYLP